MINYDAHSIKSNPIMIEQLLERMQVDHLNEITGHKVKEYFEALSKRKNKRNNEVISINTLRTHLTAIKRFAKYLRHTDQGHIEVPVHFYGSSKKTIAVLTKIEIERLYRATEDDLLGMRDRAMLAVYYGCALRRNEGIHLTIDDILPDKNLLYIRKGKNYRERYVPMVGKVKRDILNYLIHARPMLINKEAHDHLFVGINGKPVKSPGLYERLRSLVKRAEIEKEVGLHTLRHSIATHLLAEGMKLTEIARFLGHRSLESTQIYTHMQITNDRITNYE
jgi:integrase/recombinase XerD